ncbi:MAG: DUF2232 domain-containing protein [Anderseniella sp.]
MNNWIVIGIIAGLVAGLLQAGGGTGNSLAALLVFLAPLPLFIAGLGWGAVTAALATLVMAIGFLVGFGWQQALVVILSSGLAPVALSWLALKNRPASASPSDEGEVADTGVEWYPEGRLVIWTVLISAALTMLVILALGPTVDQFRASAAEQLKPVFESLAKQPNAPTAEQIENLKNYTLALLPATMCGVWGVLTMINMWLAGNILNASGHGARPWAEFGKLAFPKWAIWLLSGSAMATFLPGMLGQFAWILTAAMMLAYAILGLAVMHGLLEGNQFRSGLLATFYFLLVLLNFTVLVPLVMLAMFDQSFNIRKRRLSGSTNKSD